MRRRLEQGADLRQASAQDLMHPRPRTITPHVLATQAAQMMEQHGITSVVVVDAANTLVGLVHIRDLMLAKVI